MYHWLAYGLDSKFKSSLFMSEINVDVFKSIKLNAFKC